MGLQRVRHYWATFTFTRQEERARETSTWALVSLLIKTPILSDQGLNFTTSFYLNRLLKALVPNAITLGSRTSIHEFWTDTIEPIAIDSIQVYILARRIYIKNKPSSCREMKNEGHHLSILSFYYSQPKTGSWGGAYFCKKFFSLISSLLSL